MSTHDPEFQHAPKFAPEQYEAPPRQRGCFFYGCIIASVLAVMMLVLIGIAAYVAYRAVTQAVDQYTSTTPIELPKVEMPDEQRKAVKDRFDGFRKAVEAGTPTEPLVLTSDDLNVLISQDEDLNGKVYVAVEGDEVKGKVSIPLDKLGIGMVRGRFLNGEADFKASLQGGVLIITLDAVEVNGLKVPEPMMTELRKQNLAKDMYKDQKSAEMIRKFESLEVKDGKITIKVRAKPDESKSAPAANKDAKATPVEVIPSPRATEPKNGVPVEATPKPNGEPEPSVKVAPAPKS
jgi:hypothetical protein